MPVVHHRPVLAPLQRSAPVSVRIQPPLLEIGSLVDDRYVLLSYLGRGSMGVVYRALDRYLRRDVALKLMSIGVKDPFQEGALLASLRHPYVVNVHAAGRHGSAVYLAMELVEGADLRTLIEARTAGTPRLSTRGILHILTQTVDALEAAHARGVLHRDVKPANIIVEEVSGRAVLVDFGLSQSTAEARPTELVAGTPAYMAPELWEGMSPAESSDVYALACTAYEALSGSPPFEADDPAQFARLHRSVAPPRISQRRPELALLDGTLLLALAKNPAARPSCRELRAAFDQALLCAPLDGLPIRDDLRRVRALIVSGERDFVGVAHSCLDLVLGDTSHAFVAGTRSEALRAAAECAPDVILLDGRFAGPGAVALLTELHALGLATHAHVVVFGAHGEDRERFGMLGVVDHLELPIAEESLSTRLQRIGSARSWRSRAGSVGTETGLSSADTL